MNQSRPALRRSATRVVAALLAALVALGAAPLPAPASTPAAGPAVPATALALAAGGPEAGVDPVTPDGELRPSIAYEQAMAHANDKLDFTPGGRVDVPFIPRTDDIWTVDGKRPMALPAGRATGRDMARSPQGSAWSALEGSTVLPYPSATPSASPAASAAPVDSPSNASPIPATGSVFVDPQDGTVVPASTSALRKQVLGFLPYWELASGSTLDYSVISTVAYFSVGADKYGNLIKKNSDGTLTTGWSGWTSSRMTSVINAAHLAGTRVVLTVSAFAWTSSQATTQAALLGSSTARSNLAKQIAAAIRDRGADGVNLDFEPLVSGYEDEFVAFLQSVRTELNAVAPGYQVTYDTTGYIGNYPLEASVAAGAADAIFIMGYDYRTSSTGYVGSIDPLAGPAYDLTDTVRAYTARVPGSKIILGVPWYGRAWSTVSDAVNAQNQSGTKYGASTAVNYETVVDLVAKYGRRWDTRESSPWFAYQRENCTSTYGCVTSWRQVYYDDAESLRLRYELVNSYGLRGAGIWALGYDGAYPEMKKALADAFLNDTVAPVAGITMLPTTQADEGFVVTWSATDVSPVASYDVQVSVDGGTFASWLTGTTLTSEVYLGLDGHGYAFRVRATDAKGNTGAWDVTSVYDATPSLGVGGFGRVRIDGLSYRTGPSTTAAKIGSLAIGTIVAVTSGPFSADGYTWWEVTQPIREWNPVSGVEKGVWVASGSSTESYLAPYRVPNGTLVNAGITGFGFGGSGFSATSATTDARTFSPDADGTGDGLVITWTNTVALTSLNLFVYTPDGPSLGSRPVAALAAGARSWTWDGVIGDTKLPDGTYVLQLVGSNGSATFRAPSVRPVTPAQVTAFGVVIDTIAPAFTSARLGTWTFSPNDDLSKDTASLLFAATGATSWKLRVASESGTPVRTVIGSGGSGYATWNGRTDAGSYAADGIYRLTLYVFDAAGNSSARAFRVIVDTVAPVVGATVTPSSFSPNGDAAQDTTALGWSSNEAVTGVVRILEGTTLVRSWTVSTRTGWSVAWDGKNASGVLQADGRYGYQVDVKDAAGVRRVVETTVTLDRTAGFLRWSRPFYPQDGDALVPSSVVSFKLIRQATTTLRILDATGNAIQTAWTGKVTAAGTPAWTWNGRMAAGTMVQPGRYVAELTVTSSLGTTKLLRTVIVDGFVWSLSSSTVTAGQALVVNFRTVEPLSTTPSVTFAQPGRSAIRVTASKLADGSYRATFTIAAGPGGIGTITIAARDSAGATNVSRPTVAVVE